MLWIIIIAIRRASIPMGRHFPCKPVSSNRRYTLWVLKDARPLYERAFSTRFADARTGVHETWEPVPCIDLWGAVGTPVLIPVHDPCLFRGAWRGEHNEADTELLLCVIRLHFCGFLHKVLGVGAVHKDGELHNKRGFQIAGEQTSAGWNCRNFLLRVLTIS